jgi:hypothetical protein
MTEKTRDELEVELRCAYEMIQDKRNEIDELKEDLTRSETLASDQSKRCSSIVATYHGMRTRLDMVFGAPNGSNPQENRAQGRPAGLEGAVDWAIAEYGRVTRELREKN